MIERLIAAAAGASTCQKRVTVCVIYDHAGVVLACESNRCDPDGGRCHRIGVSQDKAGYPSTSTCNWHHAEARAVAALRADQRRPDRAVVYGHTFPCDDCERALRAAGVGEIECVAEHPGVGLRPLT